jgi:hypothetical protein
MGASQSTRGIEDLKWKDSQGTPILSGEIISGRGPSKKLQAIARLSELPWEVTYDGQPGSYTAKLPCEEPRVNKIQTTLEQAEVPFTIETISRTSSCFLVQRPQHFLNNDRLSEYADATFRKAVLSGGGR